MRRPPIISTSVLLFSSAIVASLSPLLGALNASISPPAQAAVQQGLDAIQKGDFQRSRNLFQEAFRMAGPAAYYDIGLAEAKIPGRELRAICWLAAYLAVNPSAPNAAEIRKTIFALDATSRDKIRHLLQTLQDFVRKMPDGDDRNYGLRSMVGFWGGVGDYVAAQDAVDFIKDPNNKSDALQSLASAYVGLISQQAQLGDVAGAHHSLEKAIAAVALISNPATQADAQYEAAKAWTGFAKTQLKIGDLDGIEESLVKARQIAESSGSSCSFDVWGDITALQVAVAKARCKAGAAATAKESLAAALNTSRLLQGDPFNGSLDALRDIAEAQIKAGDVDGARTTLAAALTVAHSAEDLNRIGNAQIRAGDLAAAKKTADLIHDATWKTSLLHAVTQPIKSNNSPTLPELLPSDRMAYVNSINDEEWTDLLGGKLDKRSHTNFPDYSDYMAMAAEMKNEPIEEGQMPGPGPLDQLHSLTLVVGRMLEVQSAVDDLLKIQFKK